MPTDWEQFLAKRYVNKRQIYRPSTNIKMVITHILLFMVVAGICSWLIFSFLSSVSLAHLLPNKLMYLYENYALLFFMIIYCIVCGFGILFSLKFVLIGFIRLYQHYAPDEIRRRCLFMPTCSEYTIIAVRKYGVVTGLYKSYIRLFYRCKGNIYMIDYP